MLKGFLIHSDIEPPRTHALQLLCKMCADIDEKFEEISESCSNLTVYGVQSRYPFELDITDNDMKKAIIDADRIIEFVLQRLNIN